jgi:hypothetical protein
MATRIDSRPLPGLDLSWPRLGGVFGILGVVLFVIGAVMEGDLPVYTQDPATISAWFEENGDRFLLADFIIALGVLFGLVPFFAVLRLVTGRAAGEASAWPAIMLLGGLLFVIVGAIGSVFNGTLALGGEFMEDDAAVAALATLAYCAFSSPGLVVVLFFIGLTMVILRTGVFAAPIAWLCLALSVTGLLSGLATVDGDPEGLFSIMGQVTTLGWESPSWQSASRC